MNQTRYGVYHGYLECKTKNFCYSLSRKKVSFLYGNLRISRITNFKNRSFSSGQGVVQIEPNSVYSIPCVPKIQNERIFAIAFLGKKLAFRTLISD